MKPWERDLLDHLVLLVLRNAEPEQNEDQVRDDLKREFRPFLSDERPAPRPAA